MIDRLRLEQELVTAMGLAATSPMRWGTDDCALWCANILKAALGYDPAASYRGRYRTARGARRALDRTGLPGLPGAIRKAARDHRWRPVDPAAALVGDIGLVGGKNGPSCCVICRAPGWFVGRDEAGFTAVPASAVRVAWSIA